MAFEKTVKYRTSDGVVHELRDAAQALIRTLNYFVLGEATQADFEDPTPELRDAVRAAYLEMWPRANKGQPRPRKPAPTSGAAARESCHRRAGARLLAGGRTGSHEMTALSPGFYPEIDAKRYHADDLVPVKLQDQHRPFLPLDRQISADAGRKLAARGKRRSSATLRTPRGRINLRQIREEA